MIQAGNYQIQDNGFAVSNETIQGTNRQALVLELPGGIDAETLEALCAGPIEVLNEEGEVVQTHEGPFALISHGLKFVRSSADSDVAVLSARVATLEAELSQERSEKASALGELASLSGQLQELKTSTASTGTEADDAAEALTGDGTDSL